MSTATLEKTEEVRLINRWRENPEAFDAEAFKWNEITLPDGSKARPTEQQKDAWRAVKALVNAKMKAARGEKLTEKEKELSHKLGISIVSGHGTGKDAWLARLYLWALSCLPNFLGLVTAPTSHQLESNLWREFRKWLRYSHFLEEIIEIQSDKVFMKGEKGEWFVEARTANVKGTDDEQGETLAGRHADYMILAVDESSGVPKGVFKPIEGGMTGLMNFAVLIGNGTRGTGYFFDSHNTDSKRWITLVWSSEDTPLVPQYLLEAEKEKYGYDSNYYRVRRRGMFPKSDEDTLIPYEWVMDAINREFEHDEHDLTLKGIDVGGGGDKTVILTRVGNTVYPIAEYDSPDTMKTTGWIASHLAEDDHHMAFIDPVGLGAGIYDRLKELRIRKIYPVDVREDASENDRFFRLRDEIYWRVREKFEQKSIAIPNDEELIGELTTIKYDQPDSTKGKIKIESKKDMRKRGVDSPNKADALAMTYYFGDRTYQAVGKDIKKNKRPPQAISWKVV